MFVFVYPELLPPTGIHGLQLLAPLHKMTLLIHNNIEQFKAEASHAFMLCSLLIKLGYFMVETQDNHIRVHS